MAHETHGFALLRDEDLPELRSCARLYRHEKTGARLLTLSNDDENKCFGISFRTPPTDSTGVAHILEHSVLCGSRKYPLKDPFVELLKGSLQTFLNAFTYPDKTVYPVASTNLRDFYNLVDVYLDTVLYPRLDRETFLQQGWHYELDRPDGELIYKGVVFNEMKGAYSSPDARLGKAVQQSLFPDNAYGVDSGGDPAHILDLTYDGLKAFHAAYYHPSNAWAFFAGDDPEEERLRLLNEYLKDFDAQPVPSEIALQPRFPEPKSVTAYYPVDDEAAKTQVSVNWMLTEQTDPETTLALSVLSHALIGTSAAPLRKALIDSGLGEALTSSGLEEDLRQMTFSVGLKGVLPENADRIEPLVLDTLRKIAEDGIERGQIEASLNTMEFRLREQNTGGFPRGLAAMLGALSTWLHEQDPLAPLRFETPLAAVKTGAQTPGFFESLIQRHLLDNPHRTAVTLKPAADLAQRETEAESRRLADARTAMTDEITAQIIAETETLKRRQETPETPEALASLPSLTLGDLDKEHKPIPVAFETLTGVTTLTHDLFTGGIAYLDLGFDLHAVPAELLPLISLYGRSLFQLGTQTEDFVRLTQRIGQTTGGVGASAYFSPKRDDPKAAARLFVRGKAATDHTGDLFGILRDVLLRPKFDNPERFRQLALEDKARIEAALVPGGLGYVSARLRAGFDEAGWLGEVTGGIESLFFLRELVQTVDTDWPSVRAKLERIHDLLIRRGGLIANLTLDAAATDVFRPALSDFLAELPEGGHTADDWPTSFSGRNEGLTIPAQVNYVGKAANLYALGYQETGAASVISKALRTGWLWQQVRVQGGAYGGFCSFDSLTGVFTLLSYRDPNLTKTLDIYDRTAEHLRGLTLSEQDLTRSVIGAISDVDRYQLPDAKGFTSLARWLAGETDETLQRRRDQILGTTAADFRAFADALAGLADAGRIAVLGSAEDIQSANAERPGLLEVVKVL